MRDRMEQELDLIRREHPRAEWHPAAAGGGWVLLPGYRFPGGWNRETGDVCFEARPGYPGEAPYGFYVGGGLRTTAGQLPQSYQEPTETPFGGVWGKFSWSHDTPWAPRADVVSGCNLAAFVRTFRSRLEEGA